ncbi:helix-turn-helix protein [Mucilaginibacter frigoritolerans]|uniref:Helix-turn-helix protein n=1 Tax=Mucilaginibacter frigoritolerans TaxID=652788 RepID=A0A562TUF7_9SPHI|nr:helix-turn-helix transcriptional regulator [Mucilaginibacter frigoritolerans]TWI96834.1 helix-turn-helix protein [Mucilaginibacter frigoritolerans]
MNGAKIRMIRELRGFSQENMAAKLGINQASYSRIENNQTKLDTIMLEKIAGELGVTPVDILSHEPTVVNFAPNQGTQGIGHIENFYSFQKDLVEKVIQSKDQEIANLKDVIASLVKDKEALMALIQEKK